MLIAPATRHDAEPLAALVNRAYRGESAEAGWANEAGLLTGQRTDPDALRTILDLGGATILLARDEQDGPLIGCVSVEPATGSIWYLSMLTIDPGRQDGGLGRGLLAEGERFAGVRGATRIRLTVIQVRAALIAWYQRRGYRLTGETEPFPYNDERFGTPLRPDLHFAVMDKELTPRSA